MFTDLSVWQPSVPSPTMTDGFMQTARVETSCIFNLVRDMGQLNVDTAVQHRLRNVAAKYW